MFITKDSDKDRSYNFVAPVGAEGEPKQTEVLFPASEKLAPVHAPTHAVAIRHMDTFFQPATATANITVNLTIGARVTPGAKLHVKVTAGGANRNLVHGDGFATLANVTIDQDATYYKTYVYDGTSFIPCS